MLVQIPIHKFTDPEADLDGIHQLASVPVCLLGGSGQWTLEADREKVKHDWVIYSLGFLSAMLPADNLLQLRTFSVSL